MLFFCPHLREYRRILRRCGNGSGMMTGAFNQAHKTPKSAGTTPHLHRVHSSGSGLIPYFWRLLHGNDHL